MKKRSIVQKLFAIAAAAALSLSLCACAKSGGDHDTLPSQSGTDGAEDGKTYKVAIIKQMDHASLDEIAQAVERRLDEIAAGFGRADLTEEERRETARAYTEEYNRIRREQLRFIVEHKEHLAAVYALSQRLPGDRNLFNGDSDVVYYRTVAEAIEKSYPRSPYLASLNAEIARMDARITLASGIAEAGYPDLVMNDMYGREVRLSSLEGKVVLVDFWSAELGNSNVLNAELKQIHARYKDSPKGFEVYQVAVDTNKPLWIAAVQEQRLPWISVSDLLGRTSPALGLYNVRKLPANFLIDSEGTVVARDLYGRTLEQKLDELTR